MSIPTSGSNHDWEFILLNNNDFFFFDKNTYLSTWNIPPEVAHTFSSRNIKVLSENKVIQVQQTPLENHDSDISKRLELLRRAIGSNLEENENENESDNEEGDSDSDDFEVFDHDGKEVGDVNALSENHQNHPVHSENSNNNKIIGKKRERPNVSIKEGNVKKKRKKVGVIGDFWDLMNEGVSNGKITSSTTYQKFFMIFMRDIRFRRVSNNNTRKKLFKEKIIEISTK